MGEGGGGLSEWEGGTNAHNRNQVGGNTCASHRHSGMCIVSGMQCVVCPHRAVGNLDRQRPKELRYISERLSRQHHVDWLPPEKTRDLYRSDCSLSEHDIDLTNVTLFL